jgi:LemA protein
MLANLTPPEAAAIVAGVGALIGWSFATAMRRRDATTFVLARAPQLPIRALAAHDDAWLRGEVRAAEPLRCPWFDVACVAYTYTIEREVTRTVTDSNGKTRTESSWDVEHSTSDAVDFDLHDGATVRVALREGNNEAMQSAGTDYEGARRRHSATVLPVGATVSALGVLRDDGTFGPLAEVPLLVTEATREQRVRASANSENWFFFFALFTPWAGITVAGALLTRAQDWQGWLAPMAIGFAAVLPVWWLLTHNRLVRLRQQVKAAQKQTAVELAMRADLVPNLVAAVQGHAAHERELLERLAGIRVGRDLDREVREERAVAGTMRGVLLLHERYPQLRSDALYRDLHERLWAIEEKLAHARGFYNEVVTEWNDRIAQFPSSLVAGACGYRESALFAAEIEAQMPPRLA